MAYDRLMRELLREEEERDAPLPEPPAAPEPSALLARVLAEAVAAMLPNVPPSPLPPAGQMQPDTWVATAQVPGGWLLLRAEGLARLEVKLAEGYEMEFVLGWAVGEEITVVETATNSTLQLLPAEQEPVLEQVLLHRQRCRVVVEAHRQATALRLLTGG